MSKKKRNEFLNYINTRPEYTRIGESKKCYYCGAGDDLTKDHFPPRKRFREGMMLNIQFNTVCACRKCNEFLANTLQRDINERKRCIETGELSDILGSIV